MAEEGLVEKLFEEITQQLESKGLILKHGTLVDATIIASVDRPLSDQTREELEANPSPQIDTDAAATTKNGTWYFGYKGHIGVDVGSKLVRTLSFTAAAPHDSTQREDLLSGDGTYYGILGQSLPEHPNQRGSESP